MFQNNWLKYGFGQDLESFSPRLPFTIDYGNAYEHPRLTDTMEIAQEACWHIYHNFPKPITLMLSGGVDSQAMAYAFKVAEVPFRAITARYNDGLNDHDIEDTGFYAENGIHPEILDLDIMAFHREELRGWAKKYRNNSPHLLTHCKIASMVPYGTVVSSGAIVSRYGGLGIMNYSVFGLERYARIAKQPVVGFFFSYSPTLVYATRDLKGNDSHDSYDMKCQVYQEAGFKIVPQLKKLHGFERLKEMFDDEPIDAKLRLRYSKYPSLRPYDMLYRYPLMDLASYSQDAIARY